VFGIGFYIVLMMMTTVHTTTSINGYQPVAAVAAVDGRLNRTNKQIDDKERAIRS
jgi:hypothetical protein